MGGGAGAEDREGDGGEEGGVVAEESNHAGELGSGPSHAVKPEGVGGFVEGDAVGDVGGNVAEGGF